MQRQLQRTELIAQLDNEQQVNKLIKLESQAWLYQGVLERLGRHADLSHERIAKTIEALEYKRNEVLQELEPRSSEKYRTLANIQEYTRSLLASQAEKDYIRLEKIVSNLVNFLINRRPSKTIITELLERVTIEISQNAKEISPYRLRLAYRIEELIRVLAWKIVLEADNTVTDQASQTLINELRTQISILSEQFSNLIQGNQKNVNKLDQREQEIQRLTKIISELDNAISERDTDIAAFRQEIQNKKEAIQNRQSQIESLQNDLNKREQEINRLNQSISELDSTVSERDTNIAAFRQEIQNLRESIYNRQSQIDSLQNGLNERKQEINRLTKSISELDSTISERDTNIAALRQEIQNTRQGIHSRQSQIDELQEEVTRLKKQKLELQRQNEMLRQNNLPKKDETDLFNEQSRRPYNINLQESSFQNYGTSPPNRRIETKSKLTSEEYKEIYNKKDYVYVEEYSRKDGTPVKAHYRRKSRR